MEITGDIIRKFIGRLCVLTIPRQQPTYKLMRVQSFTKWETTAWQLTQSRTRHCCQITKTLHTEIATKEDSIICRCLATASTSHHRHCTLRCLGRVSFWTAMWHFALASWKYARGRTCCRCAVRWLSCQRRRQSIWSHHTWEITCSACKIKF